ncbi:CRISPR-associated helicase Cas3' [bacterium]|nr:CRISPR-associated helicase Cas3' [bacterium]
MDTICGKGDRNPLSAYPAARLSRQAQLIWAKTGRDEQSHLWEPLYVHLGDTMETARLIWERWLASSICEWMRQVTGLDDDTMRTLVMLLAGWHDVGKATPCFASKQQELAELVRTAGLRVPGRCGPCPHALIGQVVVEDWLRRHGWDQSVIDTWVCVIGAHHGVVPDSGDDEKLRHSAASRPDVFGDEAWGSVREELLDWIAAASGADDREDELRDAALPDTVQVILIAIVIMADWIASNSDFFPLVERVDGGDAFVRRAEAAWDALALPGPWRAVDELPDDDELFRERFRDLPPQARLLPAQRRMLEAAHAMDEPGIVIDEAPMGTGKTEGALLAAEVLASKFHEGGVCFLLPTMATSNAMFMRVAAWLHDVPDQGGRARQSMELLHSKAALNGSFAHMRDWGATSMGDDPTAREDVIAHQWFGGRKRGLLASFTVGTIDQGLMAALRQRHVQLRHLGLAGKVVVIDEVHAYDAYMNVYLDQLLSYLGAYRVPVILLSATLPPRRRQELVMAYQGRRTGRRGTVPAHLPGDVPRSADGAPAYPLVTTAPAPFVGKRGEGRRADGGEIRRYPSELAGHRPVDVACLADDAETLCATLQAELVDGGCVCVLRDTVRRAQETYAYLKDHLAVPTKLVHSRFVASDRMRNDDELIELLGKDGARRPETLVVVGTQVLEQSLDIDFDLLVTDVAPVDLLLQRIGRLHRHERGDGQAGRPPRLRRARCLLTGVEDWEAQPPRFARGVDTVYKRSTLWRSLAALGLPERPMCGTASVAAEPFGTIDVPGSIASLVERVYERLDDMPPTWRDAVADADARLDEEMDKKRRDAKEWLLPRLRSRCSALVDWMSNEYPLGGEARARAQVRDTDESLEVVVVMRRQDGRLRVLPSVADAAHGTRVDLGTGVEEPDDEAARLAATSTLDLPAWVSRDDALVDALVDGAARLPGLQESRWLRGQIPLVVDERGDATLPARRGEVRVHYDACVGLTIDECGRDDDAVEKEDATKEGGELA